MPLLETLALSLGPSIAKAIVKTWLGQGWKTDLAGSLVDLAKGQGEKALAQRDKQHQLDKIGEQIAARMHILFKSEGARLDEQERALVAQEVALTLAQSKLSAGLLIAHNLNAQRLARHLIGLRPDATRPLSATQAELYERTLTEAARAITQVADQLSGFDRVLTAAQLESDDRILDGIARLLAAPSERAARFEQKYREVVKKQLDKMDIFGVPDVDPLVRKQSLSVAYITLDVDQDDGKAKPSEGSEPSEGFRRRDEVMQTRSGPADQILALSRRLVIRGQAGSGKSTLLHWIAVRSASRDFSEQLANWNDTVPFFIRLRALVNLRFPSPEDFPRQIALMIAGEMPPGWAHDQLEGGRALVLIDGVDELPREQRGAMLESLRQLVASFPLARYIVTSRPAALKADEWPEWQEWVAQEGFAQATLQPMSAKQIESFIDHWHAALAQALTDEDECRELEQHPASLKRLLRGRLPLRRLATSPLLCSMICALYRERRQSLPAERIELYRQCVEMLLSGREQSRKISQGDYPNLSHAQKLALIQSFAYWLMRNGYSDVETVQADAHFEDKLALMNLPGVTGTGVRRLFVERTSLLREPVANRIDFTHRTFQEYLAAQAAINANDMGVLIKNSLDDQWHEMIILAAGEARRQERDRLLKGLITKGDKLKRERNRHQLYLLACACLETCVELAPQVRQAVLDKAAALIPPKDDDEVKLIAAAGDPIVPLLKANPQYDERQAARCVDVLALIGSDAAMSMLTEYATDTRWQVRKAIGSGWNSFDRQKYARQMLARSDTLVLPDLASWEGFEHLGHVTDLTIWGGQISDLSPLASLTNLTTLIVGSIVASTPVSDLSPLAHFTNLTKLGISETQVSDLSPLASLTNLATLIVGSLFGGSPVSNLDPLAHLINLQRLYIVGTLVSDLRPLASLTNLAALDISWTRVSNLSSLAHLTNLAALNLSGTQISDLSPLARLINLATLDISVTPVSDLSPLARLTNLQELYIGETQVSDLSPLAGLTNLRELSIGGTQVSDLSPLAHLPNLQRLAISKDSRIDLSPLQGKSGLEIIKS